MYSFVDGMSSTEQKELEDLMGKAIFTSNCALFMFENPAWTAFFKKLRPSFQVPGRKNITTTMIDKQYEETHKKVTKMLFKVANT